MAQPLVRAFGAEPQADARGRWRVVALLAAGVAVVAYAGWPERDLRTCFQLGTALIAGVLVFLPPVRRAVLWLLDRLRDPSPRGVRVITITLALLAANYFIFTGLRQGRELIPKLHDESMYLIQAQMAAHGRLWMPALPLSDFFETFYVFVKPVYASMYFPGTALAYAPSIWLNVPSWAWAALICGAVVGMTYRVFIEFLDGVWAFLGALLMLALPTIHLLSLMVMSHPLGLLLGLLLTWSWLHWRRRMKIGWAIAVGALAGAAAITRPLDAICFALPIAAAMLWELRATDRRKAGMTLVAACAGLSPFVTIQLIFDRAVTGHLLQTPVSRYAKLNWPEVRFGPARHDPSFRPPSRLPEVQQFYRDFVAPSVIEVQKKGLLTIWRRDRLPAVLTTGAPLSLLLIVAPLGLLGIGRRSRWIVVLWLPLFVGLYMLYPPFLNHYALVATPSVLLLVVMGAREIVESFSPGSQTAAAIAAVVLGAIALTSLSELNPWLRDPNVDASLLANADRQLSEIPRPAVVLFHFDPGNDANEEPVYNTEVPWPDDARVIRAHDLGEQNIRLFRYYAGRSPRRMIYLYDESNYELRELGMADALAGGK